MKIVKPTIKELKDYYVSNKDYYDLLSSYYLIHDPGFHKRAFLSIENSFDPKKYKRNKRLAFGGYFFTILIFGLLTMYYVFQFKLPDFDKGMDQFNKNSFEEAKEYFQLVDISDNNYSKAIEMIKVCNEKIDEEIMIATKHKKDEESRNTDETNDFIPH